MNGTQLLRTWSKGFERATYEMKGGWRSFPGSISPGRSPKLSRLTTLFKLLGVISLFVIASWSGLALLSGRATSPSHSSSSGEVAAGCGLPAGAQPTTNYSARGVCPLACSPPVITWHGVNLAQGYRQVWVNWSDTGDVTSRAFTWGSNTNYGWATPELKGADVNINDMVALNTYYYKITDYDQGCAASVTGSFTLPGAPSNEFVGWVSQFDSDPYELSQLGAGISGATVGINALCSFYEDVGGFFLPYPTYVNLTGGTTTSNGSYTVHLPLTNLVLIPNSGGWKQNITLGANGVCTTNIGSGYNTPTYTNANYLLWAWVTGYWNATIFTTSVLSTWNDFRQFGLTPNEPEPAAQGIAFVHTSLVECGVTVENTWNQTIYGYDAGSGYTDTLGAGRYESTNPVSNGVASIETNYQTTGVLNETPAPAKVMSSYAYGYAAAYGTNGVSYTDPDGSPPSGSSIWYYGAPGGSEGWYNGGSYSFTNGISLQVSLSLGWEGATLSGSWGLGYGTTTAVSSNHEIICSSVTNPPTGYDYQFYVYVDGSNSTLDQAINVHIWYDDECLIGSPGCG
jgi:hypothetical protein